MVGFWPGTKQYSTIAAPSTQQNREESHGGDGFERRQVRAGCGWSLGYAKSVAAEDVDGALGYAFIREELEMMQALRMASETTMRCS